MAYIDALLVSVIEIKLITAGLAFFFVLSTLTYEIYDLFFFSIECHNIQVIEKDEHDMDVGHLTITNVSSL